MAAGFGAGTLIGAATIGMAALRLWTLKQGVTYCAIALPAGILLTQYWAWKWMRFRVIATAD